MSRNKKLRYAQNAESDLVLEPGKELFEVIKGNWNKLFFDNSNDIVVEFACGRGEYTTNLASRQPNRNFIGVDIKGARLWMGCKEVKNSDLQNVGFLRTDILMAQELFAENEVSEIWITFPDPRPKARDEKKRLTSPRFLEMYKKILKPGGFLHLKTDNSDLFDYSLLQAHKNDWEVVHATKVLYDSPLYTEELQIKTNFEVKFNDKGFDINYLRLRNN